MRSILLGPILFLSCFNHAICEEEVVAGVPNNLLTYITAGCGNTKIGLLKQFPDLLVDAQSPYLPGKLLSWLKRPESIQKVGLLPGILRFLTPDSIVDAEVPCISRFLGSKEPEVREPAYILLINYYHLKAKDRVDLKHTCLMLLRQMFFDAPLRSWALELIEATRSTDDVWEAILDYYNLADAEEKTRETYSRVAKLVRERQLAVEKKRDHP